MIPKLLEKTSISAQDFVDCFGKAFCLNCEFACDFPNFIDDFSQVFLIAAKQLNSIKINDISVPEQQISESDDVRDLYQSFVESVKNKIGGEFSDLKNVLTDVEAFISKIS